MPDLSSWQIHEPSGHLDLYNVKENVSEGEKLIQNWTKWLVSQPHGTNPARDKTGNYTVNANKDLERVRYFIWQALLVVSMSADVMLKRRKQFSSQ